jgi:hypothetical protein
MLWLSMIVLLAACGQSAPQPVDSATVAAGDIVLSSINGANPGGNASATIAAPPNTHCTIAYITPDGRAGNLPGLGPKATDAHGRATWSWYIATNTPRGTGMVAITCGGVTRSERILIGVGE